MFKHLEDQSPRYSVHLWRNSQCDLSNLAKAERSQNLLICNIVNYSDLFRSPRTPSPQSKPRGAGLPRCRKNLVFVQWRGYHLVSVFTWSLLLLMAGSIKTNGLHGLSSFLTPQFTTLLAIWFQNTLCFDSAPSHPKFGWWELASILPGGAPCTPCLFTFPLRRDKHVLVFHSCSSRWSWTRTKISFSALSLWSSWERLWEPSLSLYEILHNSRSLMKWSLVPSSGPLPSKSSLGLPASSAREKQPKIK